MPEKKGKRSSGPERIIFAKTTDKPKNRVVIRQSDYDALNHLLATKHWLENEVFSKIKPVEFDCCLAS